MKVQWNALENKGFTNPVALILEMIRENIYTNLVDFSSGSFASTFNLMLCFKELSDSMPSVTY